MLNLTPHPITLKCEGGMEITYQPSGTVARVSTIESVVGSLELDGDVIPVVTRSFGDVTGLPEEGIACIVSAMVLGAIPGRRNVFAPDTGDTAIRNAKGFVQAVTRLVAA
jgi:hypothetical protein